MTPVFPFTESRPVRFSGALPARVDVTVIGGGIAGVMTAWFLRQKGLSVLLCEKGRIAAEQSSRNWGWIRQQGRDPGELPIMIESLAIWKSLAAELGEALGFQQTGVMYLGDTAKDMDSFEAWMEHARAHQLDSRMMTAAEVSGMLKDSAKPWKGAIFTASDCRAEPWVAVPLLAAAAEERGVILRENCAVRALDLAAGRVAGVVTERGRVACDQVVVAAGAWSRLFLGREGVKIPQLSVLSSVCATTPMPEIYPGAAADGQIAFRRRADGGYTLAPGGSEHDFFIGPDAFASMFKFLPVLKNDFRATTFRMAAPQGYPDAWSTKRRWKADEVSPFETCRILNPKPSQKALDRLLTGFAAAFPGLGRPKLQASWAGMIDTMPDVVPVLDHAPIPGLTIATGLSGHGFGIGPGIGRVVADLVTGGPVGHDLSRFRFSRFNDGSKIAPGPSL
ncbi:FAD-binding oxidoreductase [Xinfangfangia sp. CPCC 101601]|uniref:FAD-binding oxidoreductase n=1 Tax=Pseudogemmobacter lacusdianii TaxID=3069608 RepID=A0ABU0VZ20_9RHOB|nr:FAD-binding oxidoreductase [Xinfangfangia sp. CPCC 101601]MDQ2066999.1 FAD-binding oxidoreductase [Xinfangfangia sp. CPCC 101601]